MIDKYLHPMIGNWWMIDKYIDKYIGMIIGNWWIVFVYFHTFPGLHPAAV